MARSTCKQRASVISAKERLGWCYCTAQIRSAGYLHLSLHLHSVHVCNVHMHSDVPASTISGLEPHRLQSSLGLFFGSLFSQLAPQCDRLQEPNLREKLRKTIADAICDEYTLVRPLLLNFFFDRNEFWLHVDNCGC